MMININFDSNNATISNLPDHLYDVFKYRFLLYLELEEYSLLNNILPLTTDYGNTYTLIKQNELGEIIVPTGLLITICNKLKSLGAAYTINKDLNTTNLSKLPLLFTLREYQKEAVEKALKYKRGVVQIPTRGGKSYCIAEIIRQFTDETNILIVVPTLDLLDQLTQDIKDYLALDNKSIEIGKIGGKFLNIQNVTVSTIDSLYSGIKNNKPPILDLLNKTEVLLADEVHNYINYSGLSVLSNIKKAEYKIGLTATAIVNNPYLLEGYLGPIIYKVTPEKLIELGIIKRPHTAFLEVPTKSVSKKLLDLPYSNWAFNQLYRHLIVEHETRNKLIADVSEWIINLEKGPVLILVKKVNTTSNETAAHSELIQELLKSKGYELPIIHGNTKNRADLLNDLRNNKLNGAIASVKILSEGVTIPSLFSIVLACAGSKERDFVQRCGRTLACKNDIPLIVDFNDKQSYFSGQSYKRMEYAEENYKNSVKVFNSLEELKTLY